MINAVLFDIDGTLINSLGNYLQAYKETLHHYGFSFSDEEISNNCFGHTEEAICKELEIPDKTEEFRSLYFSNVKKGLPSIELFPDAIYTLKQLKEKQIKIALITFAHNWYITELSKLFNLNNYAQIKIGFNDVTNSKPDPEAVNKTCQIFEIQNEEALVVGDSKSDILMGKNARSKTALYIPEENKMFYDFSKLVSESDPDFIIKTLKEILNLIT